MDWSRLKKYPIKKCSVCNRKRAYTNPIAKCYECQQTFCYDHIYGGQVNKSMKDNEAIRDICSSCKQKYGYIHISNHIPEPPEL